MSVDTKISVIVPCFNAFGKIDKCLRAFSNQTMSPNNYEIIFVDDCSNDGTYESLQQTVANMPNAKLYRLPQNSGSPSAPRNLGVQMCSGEFVFFLDCDDEILPDTLEEHFNFAIAHNADVVRGFLITDDGTNQKEMNRVPQWNVNLSKRERVELIIASQSTIPCSLIKRSLLLKNQITWPEEIRMGEDTVFLAKVLTASENPQYIKHPTYIYSKRASFTQSSTQTYGERELKNHLVVWETVADCLSKIGVDYYAIRWFIGLRAVLESLIFRAKRDISLETFGAFSTFLNNRREWIDKFRFSSRFEHILTAILEKDFEKFNDATKPRLLIAGYDLKFMKDVMPQLQAIYEVRTDEWSGHDSHNEQHSMALLGWADYVWCEWLLGNAVWYSQNKLAHQKLIIRMHRFELSRDFGERLNVNNVDCICCVSVLFFERLMERFPNIPREKVRLLPNLVDLNGYEKTDFDLSSKTLAMIGYLPAKKGLKTALQLLSELREVDPAFRLKLFGKAPEDLPWLKNHPEEIKYFAECEQYIAEQDLVDCVERVGFVDIKKALAEHQVGFVLSVSEAVKELPGFESFHIAVMDALAAGSLGLVKYWTGSEYIYPENIIASDLRALKERILSLSNSKSDYQKLNKEVSGFIRANYEVEHFVKNVVSQFKELV